MQANRYPFPDLNTLPDDIQARVLEVQEKAADCRPGRGELPQGRHFSPLHAHGLTAEDAWDIAAITAFFGLSNRMASFSGMQPNPAFYLMGWVPKVKTDR